MHHYVVEEGCRHIVDVNIQSFLTRMDRKLEAKGVKFVRYADDLTTA